MNWQKAWAALFSNETKLLAPVSGSGSGFFPRILESFTGAWQRNIEVDRPTVIQNWAVFSCATLIAGDISKMTATVMDYDRTKKVYVSTLNRPVLRTPNRFQTYAEFIRMWVLSMLLNGNAYVLKERDDQRRIVRLYVLDPNRVKVLVDDEGGIWYQLSTDTLAGVEKEVTLPASEVIHDRLWTLFHPLIGVSPLFASGYAAMQAAAIQGNSHTFFSNMSRPGGVLTAPGAIGTDTAERLKAAFESNYTGVNAGKVAVLGDGLTYSAMSVSAEDSQLIEQLKFSGEMICATFHVPPYKLGLGQMPTTNNVAALNQQYYDQALQPIVENIEQRLTIGLEVNEPSQVWLDENVLLRMDPATRLDSHIKSIGGALLAPNEARRMENWEPQEGGDVLYLQQQNFSLPALARRDAREDPFSSAAPKTAEPATQNPAADNGDAEAERALMLLTAKAVA